LEVKWTKYKSKTKLLEGNKFMKVLSILNYSRKNKGKVVSSIIPILIAVAFLYLLNTFVRSINDSLYKLRVNLRTNY
jgi:putative ABC transport system permease protein